MVPTLCDGEGVGMEGLEFSDYHGLHLLCIEGQRLFTPGGCGSRGPTLKLNLGLW